MNCHENIRAKRTALSLTQQQLADKVGVSRQTVVRWENGWTIPTLYYAQKLADEFGITVSELMTGAPHSDERKRPACMGAKIARLVTLSIFIVALYNILYYVINSWERYRAVNGAPSGDIRISAAYDASAAICALALLGIGVFWVVRLVEEWRRNDNAYLRYEMYRKWNVGLFLYIVLFMVLIGSIYVPVSFPFILIMALFFAAPIDFTFDFVFKKIFANKMTVCQNRRLKILNMIFAVISVSGIAALATWAICFFAMLSPADMASDWGIGLLFPLLYSCIAMFVAELGYIVARAVICATSKNDG
ncbi:MAG: helix-turn-helix domain-containing protein [Roseburia sp.]|nr:helix-turn-helix domain-containing protein [Roseburia sp.]